MNRVKYVRVSSNVLVRVIVIGIMLSLTYPLHNTIAESDNSEEVSVVNQLIIKQIKNLTVGYVPLQKATVTIKKFKASDDETSMITRYTIHPISKYGEPISDSFDLIKLIRDPETGKVTDVWIHKDYRLDRVRPELVKEVEENGESFEIEVGGE